MNQQRLSTVLSATAGQKWAHVLMAIVLLGAGMLLGVATQSTPEARAEIRTTAPPDAFKSGGQLSVPLLRDIATTLHKIDGRLARLETTVQRIQADLRESPHPEL